MDTKKEKRKSVKKSPTDKKIGRTLKLTDKVYDDMREIFLETKYKTINDFVEALLKNWEEK